MLRKLLLAALLLPVTIQAQDSISYFFRIDGRPASAFWAAFISKKDIPELNAGFEVIDAKFWVRNPAYKEVWDVPSRNTAAPQIKWVVQDTNIVEPDLMEYKRIVKQSVVMVTRFQLEKLSEKRYRKWEVPPIGPRINRGLHIGRADDVLSNAKFKPKEDRIKKKLRDEKVKGKEK